MDLVTSHSSRAEREPLSSVSRTANCSSTGQSLTSHWPYLSLCRVHQDGNLTLTQTLLLSSVPSDYGAEVLVNRAGDRLYATSRGSGVIVVYRVTSQGIQREENVFNLSGSWPRHFALKEDMMVVTDQHGDSAQIVHIDRDGLLLPGKTFPVEKQPAFVTFL